jgi:hypothetical protein
MAKAPIDLNSLVDSGGAYDLKAYNEPPEDAQARRVREAAEHTQTLRLRATLFGFALVFVSVVFVGCAYLFATGAPEDKKWATGVISMIVSGLIGYLVGAGSQARK